MRMRLPQLFAFLAVAALAGCVAAPAPPPPPPLMSPYPAAGYGYGYLEERIGPDLLRVIYHGPRRPLDVAGPRGAEIDRAANEAGDLALWRAAQIAVAENKPAFAIIERRADTDTLNRPGGWAHDPIWPYDCYPGYWGWRSRWRCRGWPATYVPPIADGRARAMLTVRLESRVTPRNVDAAATIRRMEQLYAPAAPPPGPPPMTAPRS
jgi:hypothetical protein